MYKKCYVHFRNDPSVIDKGITRVFNIYIGIKIKCLFFFLIDTIIEFIKQFVAKKYHISAWASFHSLAPTLFAHNHCAHMEFWL